MCTVKRISALRWKFLFCQLLELNLIFLRDFYLLSLARWLLQYLGVFAFAKEEMHSEKVASNYTNVINFDEKLYFKKKTLN